MGAEVDVTWGGKRDATPVAGWLAPLETPTGEKRSASCLPRILMSSGTIIGGRPTERPQAKGEWMAENRRNAN